MRRVGWKPVAKCVCKLKSWVDATERSVGRHIGYIMHFWYRELDSHFLADKNSLFAWLTYLLKGMHQITVKRVTWWWVSFRRGIGVAFNNEVSFLGSTHNVDFLYSLQARFSVKEQELEGLQKELGGLSSSLEKLRKDLVEQKVGTQLVCWLFTIYTNINFDFARPDSVT